MNPNNDLISRVQTGLIAGGLFFGIVLFAPKGLVIALFVMIALIAYYEYSKILTQIFKVENLLPLKRFSNVTNSDLANANSLLFLVILGLLAIDPIILQLTILGSACLWLFYIPKKIADYEKKEALQLGFSTLNFLGFIQLSGFVLSAVYLYSQLGGSAFLALLSLIWIMDSGAYFVGRKFGKNKLAPKTSPKKSIEGLIGGLVSSLSALLIFMSIFDFKAHWFLLITFSLVALIYSVIGDLWESALKRQAQIKDSGTILKAHGGMYDRIDSWISALPIWAVFYFLT